MKRIFAAMLILTLLCVGGLAEMAAMEEPIDRLLPDPNAGAFVPDPTPEPPPKKPNVVLPGWAEFNIQADSEAVRLPLYNPEKNEGLYDLTFALWVALPEEAVLDGVETQIIPEADEETGEIREVLYAKLLQSGLVAAGLYLQNVTLTQPVPKGSYEAFVHMQPYYVENSRPTQTNGEVGIRIHAN